MTTTTLISIGLGAVATDGRDAEFAAGGKIIDFPGFLRAYVEGSDDPDAELEDREVRLPALAIGDRVRAVSLEARGHETQPPARYTEASLVKSLEDLGVGRPSTYASIIETIQERGYVWKKGAALVPSFTAFSVVSLLEQHFADLVDYAFTARMEDDLDEIATGEEEAVPWLTRFYFGNGQPGLIASGSYVGNAVDGRAVLDPGFRPDFLLIGRPGGVSVARNRPAPGNLTLPVPAASGFPNGIEALIPLGFQAGTDASVNGSGAVP